MTPTELEHAEKRMCQKWYDLVMAEQKGASIPTLERMYSAYILAAEEYNHCSQEYEREHQHESQRERQAEPSPVPSAPERLQHRRKKKAS